VIGADASLAPQSPVQATAPRTIAASWASQIPEAQAVGVEIAALAAGGAEATVLSNEWDLAVVDNEMRMAAQVMSQEDSDFILELILLDVLGQPILDVMGNYILGS
jgi:hypothetical protein